MLIGFALLLLIACTHKAYINNTIQVSTKTCDSNAINYQKDIKPIFSNNCYLCHSTDSIIARGSGFDIEDTTSLRSYLKNDFRGDGIYGSKLLHCVLHSQNTLPMPPDYKIDTCSIAKLRNWLRLGASFNN